MNTIKNYSMVTVTNSSGEQTFLSNQVLTTILKPINLTGICCKKYHYFDFNNWCNCCKSHCCCSNNNCCFVIVMFLNCLL